MSIPLLLAGTAMSVGLERMGDVLKGGGIAPPIAWSIVLLAAIAAGLCQTAFDTALN